MAQVRFPIEAGHIMTFARALGDPNSIYCDREYASSTPCKDIIAPPTFTIASAQFDPDYGARPRIGEPWKGSGKEPTGTPGSGLAGGTGLYAEQHFEYHRPVHPGDVLTGEAKPDRKWEKSGRRGGKLEFQESITEWRNQHGERVVTSRKIVVFTSQTVSQS